MPLAKLHVLEGRYDEARLGKVSSAVQSALIRALGIPPEDFFQIIQILPKSQFRHTPAFLGLNYSDDLIVLEITFISGRPKEKRLGLLKALNDAVVSAARISPDDLLIHALRDARREHLFRPRVGSTGACGGPRGRGCARYRKLRRVLAHPE